MSELMRPTIRRIFQFIELEEDWDSYGAYPMSPVAIMAACELLLELTQDYPAHAEALVPYYVGPIPNGGVTLEWANGALRLEIDVSAWRHWGSLYVDESGERRKYIERNHLSRLETMDLIAEFLGVELEEDVKSDASPESLAAFEAMSASFPRPSEVHEDHE